MYRILAQDDDLFGLRGAELQPATPTSSGVSFRLDTRLGGGGMGVIYFALRSSPSGESPAVIKLMRPWFVKQRAESAQKIFTKEYSALATLNQRVPPTPYVVKMLDAGYCPIQHGDTPMYLPWLALEYVHGGAEGVNLERRVDHSLRATQYAFDPLRAARAVECLSEGFDAIHEVGILHRDVKPENLLCCGFGESEVFKITDFGIARPVGVATTFGGLIFGTPGYAPPEQAALDERHMGPWTDVFGMACVVYYMLTGRPYFDIDEPDEAIRVVRDSPRKSILNEATLSPELRQNKAACVAIDSALERATRPRADDRTRSIRELTSSLLPHLKPDSRRGRPSMLLVSSVLSSVDPTAWARREWSHKHRGDGSRLIRHVAWSSDGTCLATTPGGLAYWNGTTWRDVHCPELPDPAGLRFICQLNPTRWLIGGDRSTIAYFTREGVGEVIQGADQARSIEHASGTPEELAVLACAPADGPIELHAIAAYHWVRPVVLQDVASVSAISRFDSEQWLIAGRTSQGTGYVARYQPLFWRVHSQAIRHTKAFLSVASHQERGIGCLGGTDGVVLWIENQQETIEVIDPRYSISAVAIDIGGRGWAAAAGRIWFRQGPSKWVLVWEDPSWQAPIRALHADVGLVIGVGTDGSVIEGRIRMG